jgi:hypothetical protein
MQLRNRHLIKDLLNIQKGFKANATAEQMFLKDLIKFVWECGHPKVDTIAQHVLLEGPEEYSRGRSGFGSRCNSRTPVL